MTDKGEAKLFKIFLIMSVLIFVYFIADLSFSYLSVCNMIDGQTYCKAIPVIDLLPMV